MNLTDFIMDLPLAQIESEIGAWFDNWDNYRTPYSKFGESVQNTRACSRQSEKETKPPSTRPFAGARPTNPPLRPLV
jgi:hypothetical protein